MRTSIVIAAAVSCWVGSLSAQEGERPERLKADLERLRDEAAAAEKEGRADALDEVRARIKKIEAALNERQGPREAEEQKLRAHWKALEAKLARAKEEGHAGAADEIVRQLEKVKSRLLEIQGRPGPGSEEREAAAVKERIGHLERDLADAKERGQEDRADRLLREIKEMKVHLKKLHAARERGPAEDGDVEALIDRIAKVRKEAVRARRRGAFAEVKELWAEADRLEGKVHAWMAGKPRAPDHPQEPADLREAVKRLQAEVGEIRGLLKQALAVRGRDARADF
jgi:hypothetical protein